MTGTPGLRRVPIAATLGVACLALFLVLVSWAIATNRRAVATTDASAPPGAGASNPAATGTGGDAPAQEVASVTDAPTQVFASVPIVPVTGFRAGWESTDAAELTAVVAGISDRYESLELVADDAARILAALDTASPPGVNRIVRALDSATLIADLADHPNRLAFLRADQVTPAVRALAWGDQVLFGVARVRSVEDWPLSIQLPAPKLGDDGEGGYDPARAWTLVAGGDINLDGAVAHAVKDNGFGVDYPFDGGTAEITSRYCCSRYGYELARARRTGHPGAVRELLSGADLAIANFENPAPNRFRYHPAGFIFNADPALIEGLANAGIDWVSLANNHIRDAGPQGLLDTLDNLDAWGIGHGGAGVNLAEARLPSLFDVGGVTVALLGYDTIRPYYGATATRPGSNQMKAERVAEDVAAARAMGADLVVVFPHWGTEYTARTTSKQRELAHLAIDAGADLVLGNHTHWVGGMEVYKGRPIFYSLADFVFNIGRAEETMEGILVELTFSETRLVQVRVRPFFIVDKAQPNLLDPAGSGDAVLDQLFGASPGLRW
jgi:hypothetical protein